MGRKTNHQKRYENSGRPSKMTDDIIAKLEEGFESGFTDEMACLYAGISEATLYRYCDENQDFRERKEKLKLRPDITAQKTLVSDLTSVSGARFWATTRMPGFTPKQKVELGGKVQTEDVSISAGVAKVVNEFEEKLRAEIVAQRKGV